MEKGTKVRKAPARKRIYEDLMDQLDRMNIIGEYFADLVNDYMALWDIKNMLIADIKQRGVSVEYNNGGGQMGYKKNDSVSELNKVNGQMLRILNELGMKAVASDVVDENAEM